MDSDFKTSSSEGVKVFPTACNMPDLSDLEKAGVLGPHLINMLIGVDKRFPKALAAYRKIVVRLSDKAVRDYMKVRRLVLAQISESNMSPQAMAKGRMLYAIHIPDSLEDCILTVRRLFRYYDKIRNDESGFPLDRFLRRRIERVEESIRVIRNLIEHLDSDISGKSEDIDHWTAPVLDSETRTILLGEERLDVFALATAIRNFHAFAHDFIRYRRTPEGTYEHVAAEGPLDAV